MLSDTKKTKAQLIAELKELRRRVAVFDRSKAEGKRAKDSIRALQAITDRTRMEEALRQSEGKYRSLFKSAIDSIHILDKEGRILGSNPAAVSQLGYAESELIGHSLAEFLTPASQEIFEVQFPILLEKDVCRQEVEHVCKDGKIINVDCSASVVRDEQGEIRHIICHERDISERKRAEEELLETKEYYENLVGNAGDAIISVDKDQRVIVWNLGAERFYGYSRAEVIGRELKDILGGPGKGCEIREAVNEALILGKTRTYEAERYKKNGEKISIAITTTPLRDSDGNVIGLSGVHKDITKRKRLEREIVETKEFLESLVATAGDAIVCADEEGILTVWNPAAERLYGYTAEEALGKSFISLIVPVDKKEEAKELHKTLDQGEMTHDYETQRRREDGSLVWVSITNAPLFDKEGRRVGNIGIHKDITERRQADEALRESERRFGDISENALGWIWEVDVNGKYTYASPVIEKILGYEPEEVLRKHFYDLFHPEDQEELKKAAFGVFAKKEPFREFINWNVHKDGKTVCLSTSGVPILDEEGNLIGYRGADIDITERKRLEREIVEAKEYLENLVGSAGDAVVGVQTDGTIITWNTGAEELFGFRKEEALGENIRIIARGETLADMEEVMGRVQSGEVVRNHEVVRYRKDGTPVEINLTNSPIRDAEGHVIGLCGIYKDVAERKRAEREILKTKEYYENMVGSAGDAIISLDRDHRVVTWNLGAERFFGYSQSEALGRELADLLGGLDKGQEVHEALERHLTSGKVRTYEIERYTKEGDKKELVVTATPFRDSDGNIVGVCGIYKDITRRVRLEQQLVEMMEFLEQLIATAGDAIISSDRDGIVNVWNPAAERLYSYTSEETLGRRLFPLIIPEEKKE